MKNNKKIILGTIVVLVIGITAVFLLRRGTSKEKVKLTIAIMADEQVQDFNTNYLTTWLEEKTGYDISFTYIPANYDKEYLHALLSAKEGTIDAIFYPSNQDILQKEDLETYINQKYLVNLMDYQKEDSHLNEALEEYSDIHLREKITASDGGIYYFPQLNTAKKKQNFQVLWMNVDWLKQLGMEVPHTTKELQTVLQAFKDKDANKDGVKNEIPLLGCEEELKNRSYYYLLNAFVYVNPCEGENCFYVGKKADYEKGLAYIESLYTKGLLAKESFTFTKKQIQELVNSPKNLVGAFTSQSIADMVYANSPDVIARYIQVPPLKGENGQQNAVYEEPEPQIGGVIPTNSTHSKEAFALMDFMLSEEASIIAQYGQKGVNWTYASETDLSVYGSKAKIKTIHYLTDKVQNQNYNGAGPHILSNEYLDGVTWNGNGSDVEYIDTRAVINYAPFYRNDLDKCKKIDCEQSLSEWSVE